jgi:hypothetical protein
MNVTTVNELLFVKMIVDANISHHILVFMSTGAWALHMLLLHMAVCICVLLIDMQWVNSLFVMLQLVCESDY